MANHGYSPDGYVIGAAAGAASGSSAPAAGSETGKHTGRDAGRVQKRDLPSTAEEQSHRLEILYRAVERFGVPIVLLAIVLWWARNDLVQPLLRAHFDFIETVTACQKAHADELRLIGDKLEELIEVTQQRQQ